MDGRKIAVGEGLFRIPEGTGGAIALNGSRCKKCGRYYFPRVERCGVCESKGLDSVEMGWKGRLYSYTVCYFPPPSGKYKGYFPYSVGIVALEEGILIPARLVTEKEKPIPLDADVDLCLDSWRDKEGNEIVCYAYRATQGT